MKRIILLCLSANIFLCSCQNEVLKSSSSSNQFIQPITTPSTEGGEPNLFTSSDGTLYLSWIEYLNDTTDALMFSTLNETEWTAPKQIAKSSEWFVNWADFPSLVSYGVNGEYLAAHWLQKSNEGTYDYDVHISQSKDGGTTWSPSFVLHKDGISAEHGFVTLIPDKDQRVFATWLDGRHTKASEPDPNFGHSSHGHGGGAMTLRAAYFDENGNTFNDTELDDRICDCCQTDAAMTLNGPIVVYRNRSEDEFRDIYITRNVEGEWQKPQIIFADNWNIAGCPVNGPAVAAHGNNVAVVWFGMVNNKPEVKTIFSEDGGATFSDPIRIDQGSPSGRVDIVWKNENEVLATWMENTDEGADIKIAQVDKEKIKSTKTLLQTSAARQSGFPILEKIEDKLVLAYTAVDTAGITSVKSAFVNIE